jgi:energy-coupling factor transporter ATP-binding protein EcfA2
MIDIQQIRADHLIKIPLGFFKYTVDYFVHGFHNSPFLVLLVIYFFILLGLLFIFRRLWNIKILLQQKSVFLELTPPAFTDKTAYTTQQLFSVLHNVGSQRPILDRLLGKKVLFSFEIVSTRDKGIRYIVRTTPEEAKIIEHSIISYLPQVHVKQVEEYLPIKMNFALIKTIAFKLKKHFAFPLSKQALLEEYDPVAYITGMMTKLQPNEMIVLQIVISPTKSSETHILTQKILHNEHVLDYLNRFRLPWYITPFIIIFQLLIKGIHVVFKEIGWIITEIAHGVPNQQVYAYQQMQQQEQNRITHLKPVRVLSAFEQEVVLSVQQKINQSLFETTIRAFVSVNDKLDQTERVRGIKSSLAPFSVPGYQSLTPIFNFPPLISDAVRTFTFKKRLLSLFSNKSSSVLSVSEIADLYHFPFSQTTKTENIVKALSRELPAPLSLKNGRKLSVVFGNNTYGGTTTAIGLTQEERETHMYIIGRTGSGKTTLMFSLAKHDIENGEGIAFIDPHGDVSEDLLASIPEERINDLIYVNPIDLKHPIGINLLELTPGLDEDDAELEKEVVCEGVISLFRKVFSKEENANAHRIEYILRNTIYTAFNLETPTIFTIYDLFNNPPFQKEVIKHLTDENLKNFWKFEFGRAGDYQVVKMVGGVTAKVGRFLFSPTAKRILEQKKSTINFDKVLSEGKILLCNFSQGNLGEDTAKLLGTTILTKVQQAALRRARIAKEKRRPFYLYVDEFQNFATHSFIKMLSEGRKYGLSVCIAEQSTSQQDDRNIVNTILANVTTVICFRSANPIDEQLMLAQFSPYIERGDITNLSRYHFYIKISALESEEPFSGETIFKPVKKDKEKLDKFIKKSRENNAIVYKRETKQQEKIIVEVEKQTKQNTGKNTEETKPASVFPETKKYR